MKRKIASGIMLTLLLIGMLTLAFNVQPVKAEPETKVYVDPPRSYAAIGEVFSINISITNVTNLYAWQFFLDWNPDLLNATSVIEGSFLNQNTTLTTRLVSEVNNTLGIIKACCTLLGVHPYDAPSGNGTLASVTFRVKAEGECPIHLYNTMLVRLDPFGDPIFIVHTVEDGYFKHSIAAEVYFNLNPNPASIGETLTLKGILVDEFSQPLPNETVQVYARPLAGSWRYITSLTTNGYGVFMWQATIPAIPTGVYVIAIYYPGSTRYESSYNLAMLIVQ